MIPQRSRLNGGVARQTEKLLGLIRASPSQLVRVGKTLRIGDNTETRMDDKL